MNRRAMNKPTLKAAFMAAALASTISLTACNANGSPAADLSTEQTEGVVLEGSTVGGDFELTNAKGETMRWGDFEGKYRIVYFGYAFCPDVCPFDVQKIALAHKKFAESEPELAKQVQPIFITIDPDRDTPEVVGEFTAAFSDDMIGLTGTAEQVKTAADAFNVIYSKDVDENGEVPADAYLMTHTNFVYLMGKQGEPLVGLPVDLGPEAMARDMQRWIK